jgi:hypothetical protein
MAVRAVRAHECSEILCPRCGMHHGERYRLDTGEVVHELAPGHRQLRPLEANTFRRDRAPRRPTLVRYDDTPGCAPSTSTEYLPVEATGDITIVCSCSDQRGERRRFCVPGR